MDVMAMRRAMLMTIMGGGGEVLPDKEFVATTTSEMTLKDFLTAHPIPLKYEDEICWLRYYNDSAPSSGGVSNWQMYFVSGLVRQGMLTSYSNSTVAPSAMVYIGVVSANNAGYFDIVGNSITASSSTNTTRRIPTGTDVYVLHIPMNWTNFNMVSEKL